MTLPQSNRLALPATWICGALVAVTGAWAYLPTFQSLLRVWDTDPNYSQGFLIPIFALGLLVWRLWEVPPKPAPAVRLGLGLLVAAVALRGLGAYFFVTPLDQGSLLVCLAGVCLLFGGRGWFERAWPALALLAFMFPLPNAVGGSSLTEGLQSAATRAATFTLQTLGVVAAREGNVILLRGAELGVVEACSGVRMLMVFCSFVVVVAVVLPVGWGRKAVLVASAVPLAIACNVLRITAAGLASGSLGTETGHFIFHDLAGWLMMPLAFLLLGGEIYLLSKLFRPVAPGAESLPAPVAVGPAAVSVPLTSAARLDFAPASVLPSNRPESVEQMQLFGRPRRL